jgi:hypothetical protein
VRWSRVSPDRLENDFSRRGEIILKTKNISRAKTQRRKENLKTIASSTGYPEFGDVPPNKLQSTSQLLFKPGPVHGSSVIRWHDLALRHRNRQQKVFVLFFLCVFAPLREKCFSGF